MWHTMRQSIAYYEAERQPIIKSKACGSITRIGWKKTRPNVFHKSSSYNCAIVIMPCCRTRKPLPCDYRKKFSTKSFRRGSIDRTESTTRWATRGPLYVRQVQSVKVTSHTETIPVHNIYFLLVYVRQTDAARILNCKEGEGG